jgi:Ni/Co efflux regulator RcnB
MKTFILATALAAMIVTPAAADPKKGRGNSEQHERWDRDDQRGREHRDDRRGNDRRDDRRTDYRGGGRRDDRGGRGIPPGHIPPAGQCRVWFDGRPPGHQPRATSCRQARADAQRHGGRVIVGGRR